MKPNTMKKLFIIFLSAVIVVISGCSQRRDYGTQFNLLHAHFRKYAGQQVSPLL